MAATQQAVKACVSRLQKGIEQGGCHDPNAEAEQLHKIEALQKSCRWPKGAWAGLLKDQVRVALLLLHCLC